MHSRQCRNLNCRPARSAWRAMRLSAAAALTSLPLTHVRAVADDMAMRNAETSFLLLEEA